MSKKAKSIKARNLHISRTKMKPLKRYRFFAEGQRAKELGYFYPRYTRNSIERYFYEMGLSGSEFSVHLP